MPIISLKCKQCGGTIEFDDQTAVGEKQGFCEHCGTKFVYKDEVTNNTYNNVYQTTIIKNIDGATLNNADELMLSFETLMSLGEWHKAKNVLDKAIETYPYDWRTWFGVVRLYTTNLTDLYDTRHVFFLEKAKAVASPEQLREIEAIYGEYTGRIRAEQERQRRLAEEKRLQAEQELERQRQEAEARKAEKRRIREENAPKRRRIYKITAISAAAVAVCVAVFLSVFFGTADLRAEKRYERENTYNLTYTYTDAGGGEVTKSAAYVYGRNTPDLKIPDRPGYEISLYTSASYSESTRFDFSLRPERKSIALYAKITAIKYTITYENLLGGTNPNAAIYTVETATMVLSAPTRPGYNGEWDIGSIEKGSIGNKTVTAAWTPIVYTVKFANLLDGRHDNTVSEYTVENDTVNFSAPFGREGYTGAWDAAGIPAGSTGNLTVNAVWTPVKYKINYENLLGGTNPNPATYTVESGALEFAAPTRPGYTGKWDVSGIPAGSMDEVTVTAVWTIETYTITYENLLGGSNPNSVTEYNVETASIVFAPPRRTGFDGTWSPASVPKGSTGNITVTAQWAVSKYDITLDFDAGDLFQTLTETVEYGGGYDLAMRVRTGYVFGGWYSEKNGAGTRYTDEAGGNLFDWNEESDKTLYAHWIANKYVLTLGVNDGDPLLTDTYDVYYGSGFSLPVPVRTGCRFVGWYTERNELNSYYVFGTKYAGENGESLINWDKTADTTLHAYWVANDYTVTLDSGDGTAGTSVTAKYSVNLPAIESPERDGYTFVGYFEPETGNQYYDQIGAGLRQWNIAKDTTLTAAWIQISGKGTVAEPYIISSREHFIYLAGKVNKGATYSGSYFSLSADIDLGGMDWIPIGTIYEKYFEGVLDGAGHVISNFSVTRGAAGLFTFSKGTLKNLGIKNFTAYSSGSNNVGGLVSVNAGRIINCYAESFTVRLNRDSYMPGGLVGLNSGTVMNCYAVDGSVSSGYAAGGLVGSNDGLIVNSYAAVDVSAERDVYSVAVGGLASMNTGNGSIVNSFAAGTVSGKINSSSGSVVSGGLVANNGDWTGEGKVINSFFSLAIVFRAEIGSYVSLDPPEEVMGTAAADSDLKDAEWAQNNFTADFAPEVWVYSDSYPVFDYARILSTVEISDAASLLALSGRRLFSSYTLTADIDLGGAVWVPIADNMSAFNGNGHKVYNFEIDACAGNNGFFSRNSGLISGLSLENFKIDIAAASTLTGYVYAGGLVGHNAGVIETCSVNADISFVSGDENKGSCAIGGLVGYNTGSIVSSAAYGSVAAEDFFQTLIGGFVGDNYGVTVGCYSACNTAVTLNTHPNSVNARIYAGGFAGQISLKILSCVAVGNVRVLSQSASVYTGGIYGSLTNYEISVEGSYRYSGQTFYKKNTYETVTVPTNTAGLECGTAQLNDAEFFTETLGWDASVWDLTDLDFSAGKHPALEIFALT